MHKGRRHHRRPLLIEMNLLVRVADSVFYATDGAFDFAFCLIERAFGLKLGVAGDLAGRLFDRAFRLVGGAADAILAHESSFRDEIRKLGGKPSVPFASIGIKTP